MRRRRAVATGAGVYLATWVVNRSLRRVEGGSMRPTLAPGELVVVAPSPPAPVRVGSVVIVRDPRDGRPTIKRVAGVAGDRVRLGDRDVRVGARQVAVLGDDPSASTDSRTYGLVPLADVRAVALAALRPWRRL